MMTNLTEMQAAVLGAACERADGAIILPASLRGIAIRMFGAGLIARGWAREVLVDPGSAKPWRKNDDGRSVGLVLTEAGRAAVAGKCDADRALADTTAQTERPATKLALLLAEISCPKGATLSALTAATGWLPHTVRAALVRLRQKGHPIVRERDPGHISRYRLARGGAAAAAGTTTISSPTA